MHGITRRAVAVAILCIVATTGPARSASSASSGWWTASPVPLAPDVSADQLLVQGGADASAPLAYAGVTFALVDGELPERLLLRVAPGSASTPASRLALCPLRSAAPAASGGPSAEGPAFDCATRIEAAPSADGTSYEFDVAGLSSGASLDVAVVPTAQTDRVVLARPGPDALQSALPPDASTESGSTFPGPPTAFDPLPESVAPAFAGGSVVGSGGEVAAGTAGPAPVATETAAPAAAVGLPAPLAGDDSGASLFAALLFAVLVAVAVGLWAFAGRRSAASVA
jgi:hypothetical protein